MAGNADAVAEPDQVAASEIAAPAEREQPDAAKPLEQRLPSRGERIRIVGKRALASPELKDTIKRLAPAHSVEGEAPAETRCPTSGHDREARERQCRPVRTPAQSARACTRRAAGAPRQGRSVNTAAASATHEALTKVAGRIENSEKRLRDAMMKMMSEVRDAARRIDEMEFAHKSAKTEAALLEPNFGYGPREDDDARDELFDEPHDTIARMRRAT